MTREAERFAGCTPTVLIRSATCTLRLSDLFKTGHPSRTSFEAMERSFVTRRGLLTRMEAVGIAAFIPRTGDSQCLLLLTRIPRRPSVQKVRQHVAQIPGKIPPDAGTG